MGQTTAFESSKVSNVLIMGECKINGEADTFMNKRKRVFFFYGGHDQKIFNIECSV
jgi:hypothetical protein